MIVIGALFLSELVFILCYVIFRKEKTEELAPIRGGPTKVGIEEIEVKTKAHVSKHVPIVPKNEVMAKNNSMSELVGENRLGI